MSSSPAVEAVGEKEAREAIVEVQGDAPFSGSAAAAAPLDPFSRTSFQLYAILLVAALNATASGFDGSIFSSINAMAQYQDYFNHKELGSATGLIFMIFTVGSMVGSLFSGPVCDNFGRRIGMAAGSVLIMTGAAVQTAARGNASLLAGRFVLGFGVAIGTSSAPTYALELAPPQWRARIVGYYNTFFYSGSILATGVAYASSRSTGEIAFRLPLSLQLVFPLFILIGTAFIPESPRWLTMWGRKDEAGRILAKYHGGGNANHPLVLLELREFEANIELQKSSSVWNYWSLVETHNARWRFTMMAFMSIFAQLSGNSVLTYYLPSMYRQVGITTTERRLLLTFINSIVSCIGAIAGSATNDRMGRRSKLWIGSFVLAGLLGAVTGFSSQFGDASKKVGIFLFGFAYSYVYTPLTSTYCGEVLANPTRAKGMGVHVLLGNMANLYNAYVTAIAFEAIGWRYYLVFVGLNILYGVLWYVFGVETRGRTLEEMDAVFDAKFPPRAALQKPTALQVKGS
ncbi:hypothetical protein CDD80_491 [Ophiocordyceps camponoti-rufipedis]|uniref:Major facilitator superfamily (MFS) profile domain-containing protein n=1 Tax=Ophiocordyceps camponoti-rufipedis TaxID=2004952 RepID=A0A2C5XPD0_9HYPO|nr:hypothetical protein CDD80_491 [Ophiocordyceps camponoti-rufipedis]